MTLWVPSGQDFKWSVESITSRPVAGFGTTVTASGSVNTMGSWASVLSGASVTEDVWGILININSVGASGVNTAGLIDIGIDEAGGTSFTTKIPYLIAGNASTYTVGGGVYYYFPLFIKAGSSIGARFQNVTASRTARVWVTLYGAPARPETTRVGQVVEAIGINAGTSTGTAVTAGTTSPGSWTSIGSLTEPAWWWQLGHNYTGTAAVAAAWHWDIAADSAGNVPIVTSIRTETTTAELGSNPPLTAGCTANVPGGTTIYARGQCSGTPPSGTAVAVYAVG